MGIAKKCIFSFFFFFECGGVRPKIKVYCYVLPPNLGETWRVSNGVTAKVSFCSAPVNKVP